MKKRILPAILMVGLTGLCVLSCRAARVLYLGVLACACMWEMAHIFRPAGHPCALPVLYGFAGLSAVLCWFDCPLLWLTVLFLLAAGAALLWGVFSPERLGGSGAMLTLAALVYPGLPLVLLLRAGAGANWLLLIVGSLATVWACDSMALICGKAWGHRKVAPKVSPNKTWAGCLADAVTSLPTGLLLYLILHRCPGGETLTLPAMMSASFAGALFGQLGDLAASLVKRTAGVKDFSSLLPEHGGVMDKLDSMLFALPAVWACLILMGVIGV